MSKSNIIVGVGILIVLAYFLLGSSESEEDIIKTRLYELTKLCNVENKEQLPFDVLADAKYISEFFAKEVNFLIPVGDEHEERVFDNGKIRQHAIAAKKRLRELDISLSGFEITVSGELAEVILDGKAVGAVHGNAEKFLEKHRVKFLLDKSGGDWIIYAAEHMENLRD